MRTFDEKFGAAFLSSVPPEPGVYRLYDAAETLLYVGKARNLRRRLAQYRTTGRRKKDRKRRRLVRAAHRIDWQTYESDLEASLTEIQLIQSLAPRENVAGAFPFLYPFIGVGGDTRETRFCLTTSPEAFPSFTWHGAFRSREITADAFFGLMRLLRFIGHPSPRGRRERLNRVRHSYVFGYRRLPADWHGRWNALLRGTSREALEDLSLRLLDHAGARARAALVQDDLRALARFFEREVRRLAAAIAATAYPEYPVPQRDRDALFLRYRERSSTRDRFPSTTG